MPPAGRALPVPAPPGPRRRSPPPPTAGDVPCRARRPSARTSELQEVLAEPRSAEPGADQPPPPQRGHERVERSVHIRRMHLPGEQEAVASDRLPQLAEVIGDLVGRPDDR